VTGQSAAVPRQLGAYSMVRLGSVARIQPGLTLDAGKAMTLPTVSRPYLRVANVQDGWVDLSEMKEVDVPRVLAHRWELQYGDVLMTEGGDADKLGRGAVWKGEIPGCLHQNHVFAVRPGGKLYPPYLGFVTQTSYARAYFEATSSKTTGIASTSASKIASFRIPLPPIEDQIRIDGFLDAETARIDAIATKKRRLVELLTERRAGFIETEIRRLADQFGSFRLKTAVSVITVGIVVTPSAWYADNGSPALRGVNVRPGRIDLDDLVYLSSEGQLLHQKTILRTGDVVVVRTGQAGAAASVPPSLNGANCIDLLIVRPGKLNAEYLVNVVNSDWTQKHIRKHSVGTIQSHFNVETMAELPLPVPPPAIQEAVVARISRYTEKTDRIIAALDEQVSLLRERRQALITMAVMGKLQIQK